MDWIEEARKDKNNLGYWYPKVKDCGFRTPETSVISVPEEIIKSFFMEEDGDRDNIRRFVGEKVMPVIQGLKTLPFIKNGSFSNKFNFKHCCPKSVDLDTITSSVIAINYDAFCFNVEDGVCELVIRERIPSTVNVPKIYNGMPLQTEFRVFYDFSHHQALYIENYWDWDYCHEAISRNEKDRTVYENNYGRISERYRANAEKVFKEAEEKLRGVTGLDGIWSVDFLLDESDNLWLIDMAIGCRSSYWDVYRVIMKGFYQRIEAYYDSIGYSPEGKKDRMESFHEWMLSIYKDFGNEIRDEFIEAYFITEDLRSEDYPDAVVDGMFCPLLAFVIKHHMKEDDNHLKQAITFFNRGYSKNEPEEYKETFKQRFDDTIKVLFVRAVANYFNNKKI